MSRVVSSMLGFRITSSRSSFVGCFRRVDKRIPSIKSIIINDPNSCRLSVGPAAAHTRKRNGGVLAEIPHEPYFVHTLLGPPHCVSRLYRRNTIRLNEPFKNPIHLSFPTSFKRLATKATILSFASHRWPRNQALYSSLPLASAISSNSQVVDLGR
jgi:hypothetical protein